MDVAQPLGSDARAHREVRRRHGARMGVPYRAWSARMDAQKAEQTNDSRVFTWNRIICQAGRASSGTESGLTRADLPSGRQDHPIWNLKNNVPSSSGPSAMTKEGKVMFFLRGPDPSQ